MRGTENAKNAPNFGARFLGAILLQNWAANEIFGQNVGSRSVQCQRSLFLQKDALSCRKMHLPAEKKRASCREDASFRGAQRRNPHKIVRGAQEIKNASLLSRYFLGHTPSLLKLRYAQEKLDPVKLGRFVLLAFFPNFIVIFSSKWPFDVRQHRTIMCPVCHETNVGKMSNMGLSFWAPKCNLSLSRASLGEPTEIKQYFRGIVFQV